MFKKSIVYVALSLNLAACGGDPVTGKVEGNSQLVAFVSNYGAVYEVDRKKFEQWKVLANKKDKLPESKTELLSLQNQFASSEFVQKKMKESKFVGRPNFDFDGYVKNLSETGGEYMSELKEEEEKYKQYIASVKDQKNISDQAKAELDSKKQTLQEQLTKLDRTFKESRLKAASYFSEFDAKDYRVKQSLEKEASSPKRYQYHSSKKPIENCQKFVISKERLSRERAKSWVFGEQWVHEDRNYCPYFVMPGYRARDMAKLKAQLPDAAIENIRKAAGAYIRRLKSDDAIKYALKHIKRDNPELIAQINAFDVNSKRRYNHAEHALHDIEKKKAKLLSTSSEEFEHDVLMRIRNELKKAEPLYILGSLYESLEKVSDVQPDGSFTVKEDSDYLFIVNVTKNPDPRSTEIAVLRVGENNSEPLTITADDFFGYTSLPKITFQ